MVAIHAAGTGLKQLKARFDTRLGSDPVANGPEPFDWEGMVRPNDHAAIEKGSL